MGKGNDPNCNTAALGGGGGLATMDPLTPEQTAAVKAGKKLGLVEFRLTAGRRREHRRTVSNGAQALERAVDDYGLLREYEKVVLAVASDHPDPQMQERARRLVSLCNQRMVKQCALKWYNAYQRYGFRLDDLLSEGQIGLAEANEDRDNKRQRLEGQRAAEAAERGEQPKPVTDKDLKVYDANKNASFMTYGLPKVEMRIRRYIENNSERIFGARIPTEPFHEVIKVSHEIKKLQGQGVQEPTAEMLADQEALKLFGMGTKKWKGATKDAEPTAQEIEQLGLVKHEGSWKQIVKPISEEERVARIAHAMEMTKLRGQSLQERLRSDAGDEGETERGNMIADNGPSTEERADDSLVVDRLRSIMKKTLTPEEQEYLCSIDFAGMFDEFQAAENNADLASRLSVKESRVRVRRKEALVKLQRAMAAEGWVPAGMKA